MRSWIMAENLFLLMMFARCACLVTGGIAPWEECFIGPLRSCHGKLGHLIARGGMTAWGGQRRSIFLRRCDPGAAGRWLASGEEKSASGSSRCTMSAGDPSAIRQDDPRLKIRKFLLFATGEVDPGSSVQDLLSKPSNGKGRSHPPPRDGGHLKNFQSVRLQSRNQEAISHPLSHPSVFFFADNVLRCGGVALPSAGIMEEVVRLASDPSLEYRGKQSTVAKARRPISCIVQDVSPLCLDTDHTSSATVPRRCAETRGASL